MKVCRIGQAAATGKVDIATVMVHAVTFIFICGVLSIKLYYTIERLNAST